ncbi:MAG: hypothetical protein ABC585_04300 [Candidatus Methanosuratincola petrocarbonis]
MYKGRRTGRRKGVSTVIGMAIFLIIFAMAASYTFIWTQYFADYSSAVKAQIESEQLRGSERLVVEVNVNGSSYWLNVSNPTAQVAVVTQVWSNHSYQTGEWGVPAFGWSRINITSISNPDGNFKVVTLRGNVFPGTYTPPGTAVAGRWAVNWYNSSGPLGTSYLENLNLNFRWYKDVVNSTGAIGFNASAKVVALNDTAYILMKAPLADSVQVNVSINGETRTKGPVITIKDLTPWNTYQLNVTLWTANQVDMDLSVSFIGLDFAKE